MLGVAIAGAAFIGGRYLNAPKTAAGSIFGSASIRPAKTAELPATEPDAVGLVVKREDNTVSIGTHVVRFHTVRDASGKIVNREAGYDGPIIAVVVTHDTLSNCSRWIAKSSGNSADLTIRCEQKCKPASVTQNNNRSL
ncbi:MAG: hypothetical protein HY870_06220 [Chloroflexi bacterium]|nr:hypothetical protein [Chloroflexota bacterium]